MSKRIPIFLGILFVILAVWLLITPSRVVRSFIDRLDALGYDLQLRTRVLTEHSPPSNSIAIIDIDDKSLNAEGRWPWPRDKLATLIDHLQKEGATVIAFDMFFSEKEPNIAENLFTQLNKTKMLNTAFATLLKKNIPAFDADSIFAKSIADSPTVLAISFLPRPHTQNQLPAPLLRLTPDLQHQLNIVQAQGYISNIPLLQNAAKTSGFINIFPDSDGIIRRAPLLIDYQSNVYPALALQAVLSFFGGTIKLMTPSYGQQQQLEGIALGATIIPTDAKGQVLIPFIGKSYTFPYFSATDVLHGHLPQDALLGKIVFIGTSATGEGDLKATAIQNPFPGVEIQATIANGILEHNFSYKPAWTFGANVFFTIFFGLIAAFLFPYLGPRTLAAIILILPPGLLFINNWIWERSGLILSFLMPAMLILVSAIFNIIYGYLFETRRRERLKEMFGQYVPEEHIDEMLHTTSDYALHGEDREMTVLFADIRNFTSISEKLSAAELVEVLNTFFTPMTEIIFKHRGTIDKYIGDMIMAFWGAPLKDKHHARHALQSAIEMDAKLKDLRQQFAQHQWPDIKIGIGINSGMMSVGDMGSRFRRNYTVLGDAVNLAARIESLTKFYGVDILVTEATQRHQTKFVFRQLDRVKVKGKETGIEIYELICARTALTDELTQELEIFHQALADYFSQRWNEAETRMNTLHEKHPHKKIYRIYLDRIHEFKQTPPASDWDGIFVHTSK